MQGSGSRRRRRILETMIEHARRFYEHGWLMATSGNVSARLEAREGMTISASGYDKGDLSVDRFMACDWRGRPFERHRSDVPSTDARLHGGLYAECEAIGAIYHVHHLEATLCSRHASRTDATAFRDLEMIKAFGLDPADGESLVVPTVDNASDRDDLADRVLEAIDTSTPDDLPRTPGVNVREHGLYVWGRSPEEAKRHVEGLAYLFEHRWECISATGI